MMIGSSSSADEIVLLTSNYVKAIGNENQESACSHSVNSIKLPTWTRFLSSFSAYLLLTEIMTGKYKQQYTIV